MRVAALIAVILAVCGIAYLAPAQVELRGGEFAGGVMGDGTPLATWTVTRTSTPTRTPTVTRTNTATATVTETPTVTSTSTETATQTQTATVTETPTVTATQTVTLTPTVTDTVTETATVTETPTITATATITNTPTQTNTPDPTGTTTNTPTVTATITQTSTVTPTPTWTSVAGCQFVEVTPTTELTMNRVGLSWVPGASSCTTNDGTVQRVYSAPSFLYLFSQHFLDFTWSEPIGQFPNRIWFHTTVSGSSAQNFTLTGTWNIWDGSTCDVGYMQTNPANTAFDTAMVDGDQLIQVSNVGSLDPGYANLMVNTGQIKPDATHYGNATLSYNTLLIEFCDYPATSTPTQTPTITSTPTITATRTATGTVTQTAINTWTPLPTDTPTNIPPTSTQTRTGTATATATGTVTSTPTNTLPPTFTPIEDNTETRTPTFTPTVTPTVTETFSIFSQEEESVVEACVRVKLVGTVFDVKGVPATNRRVQIDVTHEQMVNGCLIRVSYQTVKTDGSGNLPVEATAISGSDVNFTLEGGVPYQIHIPTVSANVSSIPIDSLIGAAQPWNPHEVLTSIRTVNTNGDYTLEVAQVGQKVTFTKGDVRSFHLTRNLQGNGKHIRNLALATSPADAIPQGQPALGDLTGTWPTSVYLARRPYYIEFQCIDQIYFMAANTCDYSVLEYYSNATGSDEDFVGVTPVTYNSDVSFYVLTTNESAPGWRTAYVLFCANVDTSVPAGLCKLRVY